MKKMLAALFVMHGFIAMGQVPKPKKITNTRIQERKTESFAKVPADIKSELSTFTFSGIDEGIKESHWQRVHILHLAKIL